MLNKSLPGSSDLYPNLMKEWAPEILASLHEGQCITVEGFLAVLDPRSKLQEGEAVHTMQTLSLTSKYTRTSDNSLSVSVVLWDKDEFHAEKGDKIRAVDGIMREGKIHIFHLAQMELIEDSAAAIDGKKVKNALELAKEAEEEVEKLAVYYRLLKAQCENSGPLRVSLIQNK
ncbi:MAG: hypothetical protein ACE5OZ_04505 [Candidatus Heimdallarchaeota archaeon]